MFTNNKYELVFIMVMVLRASAMIPEIGRNNLIEQAAKYGTNTREDEIVNEFEKKLLNMFGLTRRPTPNEDMPIPRIMQHLYKAHMGDTSDGPHDLYPGWEPGFDLPSDDIASTVNTARSFHHKDEFERIEGLPDHHIRLLFNISTLPPNENLKYAELLLHREEIKQHVSLPDEDRMQRINIYEVIKFPDDDVTDTSSFDDVTEEQNRILEIVNKRRNKFGSQKMREPITRLVATRLVDTSNTTWERFDVSAETQKWLKDKNHGLVVEIVRDGDESTPAPDVTRHVRLRRDVRNENEPREWHHKRPLLLTYTHDGKETNLSRRSRKKRKAHRKKERKPRRKSCQRQDLYVDFSDVNWDDWIVAPHGYHAFYCNGECPFPLAEYMNATNHAIVQTLVNSVDPSLTPKPCCVPTELSPIAMLYVDECELVVLKTYQQMAVEGCGCR